jgi:hypothetical protein
MIYSNFECNDILIVFPLHSALAAKTPQVPCSEFQVPTSNLKLQTSNFKPAPSL